MGLREELLSRFPQNGSPGMKIALALALDSVVGLEARQAALANDQRFSDAGCAQEITQYIQKTTRGTISDLQSRVAKAQQALAARRLAQLPSTSTDIATMLAHQEIRSVLRELPAGEFIATLGQAVESGNKTLLAAVLTAPVALKWVTNDMRQKALDAFIGADVAAQLDDEQEAIAMVESALQRADQVVRSMEQFARAQQVAAPNPNAAVVAIRRAV